MFKSKIKSNRAEGLSKYKINSKNFFFRFVKICYFPPVLIINNPKRIVMPTSKLEAGFNDMSYQNVNVYELVFLKIRYKFSI